MKLIFRYLPLVLLLVVLGLAAPAVAKGPVDKITVVGPDLVEPIEITDPKILDRFDPWGGQFIGAGGPIEATPNVREPYQAFFHLRNNRGDLELRYMIYYYPDPAGGRGYIYLPGPGEPYYSLNTGIIIRGGSDGRWRRAMPAWDITIQDLLQKHSGSFDNVGEVFPAPTLWIVAMLGAALFGGLSLWVLTRFPQGRSRPPLLRRSDG